MATAGYLGKAKHATTLGGSYTAIDGIKEVSFPLKRASLDTSDLKDDSGWKTSIVGMAEGDVTLSGDWLPADTQQAALRTAFINGTSVFLQVLPDGTNGYKGEFYVTGFDIQPSMDGLASISVTARLSGAPTAVP